MVLPNQGDAGLFARYLGRNRWCTCAMFFLGCGLLWFTAIGGWQGYSWEQVTVEIEGAEFNELGEQTKEAQFDEIEEFKWNGLIPKFVVDISGVVGASLGIFSVAKAFFFDFKDMTSMVIFHEDNKEPTKKCEASKSECHLEHGIVGCYIIALISMSMFAMLSVLVPSGPCIGWNYILVVVSGAAGSVFWWKSIARTRDNEIWFPSNPKTKEVSLRNCMNYLKNNYNLEKVNLEGIQTVKDLEKKYIEGQNGDTAWIEKTKKAFRAMREVLATGNKLGCRRAKSVEDNSIEESTSMSVPVKMNEASVRHQDAERKRQRRAAANRVQVKTPEKSYTYSDGYMYSAVASCFRRRRLQDRPINKLATELSGC